VCAGAERIGCRSVEVGAFGGCSLLELVQRVGIDGDVKAYLGSACGPGGAQRFRFPEEVVELRAGDVVVVLHRYIMSG
jgi:hypothetical protein